MPPETSLAGPDAAHAFVLRQSQALQGMLFGSSEPVLFVRVQVRPPQDVSWERVGAMLDRLTRASTGSRIVAPDHLASDLMHRSLAWTLALLQSTHHPVFTQGKVFAERETYLLVLPHDQTGAAELALQWVLEALNRFAAARSDDAIQAAYDAAKDALAGATQSLLDSGPRGFNARLFLRAAHERGVPTLHLAGGIYQLGQGARARLIRSSMTDATPTIATSLARNKVMGAAVLRHAGVPVPPHGLANHEEEALDFADQLGYPVVVKPMDLDGGKGVAAGLKDAASVKAAYARARTLSASILVEKHVEGRDYRLVIFEGKLVWAYERVPGGVTGDGVSTVEALLLQLNADPRRGDDARSDLRLLHLDVEALELLEEQSLSAESVPAEGQRVKLRRTANRLRGGMPVGVLDRVHPDNARLAERAADALRLDLAGVDLLIPDIAVSWLESGAAVCEVNAEPTISNIDAPHVHGQILGELLQGDGRIPLIVVVGAAQDSNLAQMLSAILGATGKCVGLSTRDGVWIGGVPVVRTPTDPYAGARILVSDRKVDAAVVALSDLRIMGTGLPFDRCDVAVFAGSDLGVQSALTARALIQLTQALLPTVKGSVIVNECDAACALVARSITAPRPVLASSDQAMAIQVARALGCNEESIQAGLPAK